MLDIVVLVVKPLLSQPQAYWLRQPILSTGLALLSSQNVITNFSQRFQDPCSACPTVFRELSFHSEMRNSSMLFILVIM